MSRADELAAMKAFLERGERINIPQASPQRISRESWNPQESITNLYPQSEPMTFGELRDSMAPRGRFDSSKPMAKSSSKPYVDPSMPGGGEVNRVQRNAEARQRSLEAEKAYYAKSDMLRNTPKLPAVMGFLGGAQGVMSAADLLSEVMHTKDPIAAYRNWLGQGQQYD